MENNGKTVGRNIITFRHTSAHQPPLFGDFYARGVLLFSIDSARKQRDCNCGNSVPFGFFRAPRELRSPYSPAVRRGGVIFNTFGPLCFTRGRLK